MKSRQFAPRALAFLLSLGLALLPGHGACAEPARNVLRVQGTDAEPTRRAVQAGLEEDSRGSQEEEQSRWKVEYLLRSHYDDAIEIEKAISEKIAASGGPVHFKPWGYWEYDHYLGGNMPGTQLGYVITDKESKQVVGFLVYSKVAHVHRHRLQGISFYILRMSIHPDFWRQGAGRALILQLQQRAQAYDRNDRVPLRLVVKVQEGDDDAQRFFEGMEFHEVPLDSVMDDEIEELYEAGPGRAFIMPVRGPWPQPAASRAYGPKGPEAGLEEENVARALAVLEEAAPQGEGILVLEAGVLGRAGLEEFVARVGPEMGKRFLLFGKGSAAAKEAAARSGIRLVDSDDPVDLAFVLAGLEERANRIGYVGSAEIAGILSRLLPSTMNVTLLDPRTTLPKMLLFLGYPAAVLEGINASGLEEQMARSRAA